MIFGFLRLLSSHEPRACDLGKVLIHDGKIFFSGLFGTKNRPFLACFEAGV